MHYILALQNGKVTGILPLFETKSILFGHSLISLPCVVYGGVCSANREAENALYMSAETLGKLMGVDYIEMRNQFVPLNRFDCLSEALSNASNYSDKGKANLKDWMTKDLYVTFERKIYPDIEANFNAIPRKQRRMIRQGVKAGLESRIGKKEYLNEFYDLYARNLKNHGIPIFSREFILKIMDTFPQTFILSICKGNTMVAAVMSFVFKERLIPYFSGALKKYYQYAVNDFIYWELMKFGCKNGYKTFDFGRSKRGTGSYHFKRHWGFEPENLPFLYFLIDRKKMPEVNPTNPKYSTIINVWRNLPLPITKWLGPVINRKIP